MIIALNGTGQKWCHQCVHGVSNEAQPDIERMSRHAVIMGIVEISVG